MMLKWDFLSVSFVFCSCFSTLHGQSCRFNECYDSNGKAVACVPSTISIALDRNVSVTNTCGETGREEYCELSRPCPTQDGKYLYCYGKSKSEKHPGSYLVDNEKPEEYTWWQSQTWKATNDLGLTSTNSPLKVNITLSFGKSYHISGHVKLTFYSERPRAMFIEKSADDGHTWKPLQYFAKRCDLFYGMQFENTPDVNDPFKVQCTDKYSEKNPNKLGKVIYETGSRYHVCEYLTQKVQDYLLATNIRIRLEYPATDGRENQIGDHLKQYYYAISDIEITGRCSCNGHAKLCSGPRENRACVCQHNTMGKDCQECKPLFNNRLWSPANRTNGNECQECQCNNHGTSCVYNSTLGYGLCKGCRNNTEGDHCEKCVDKFYRDLTKPLNDSAACIACDCYPDGIINNGSCLQNATASEQLGQCACKPNVFGRKCNSCKPGHWGFIIPPIGECRACNCSTLGSRGGSIDCDQGNGQCACKATTQGQFCDECKFGYYGFPQRVEDECKMCQCDLGGAFPGCNRQTGACHCRQGVQGQFCTNAINSTFYPSLDHLLFEAESAMGNYVTFTPSSGYGSTFTGRGYALLSLGKYVHFNAIKVKVSHRYFAVVRYSFPDQCNSNNSEVLFEVNGPGLNKIHTVKLADLEGGLGQSWTFPGILALLGGVDYNFTMTYHNVSSDCKVQIDSLVLLPYVNDTRVFSLSRTHVQTVLLECVNSRASVPKSNSELSNCTSLVFSVSAELYNGTLACNCNAEGSIDPSKCLAYGGQCHCKPGVGGRTCNHCLNGYYNFTSTGCTRCGCSDGGSLSPICDITSGLCQCKANVLGSKCDQCKQNTFNIHQDNVQGCQYCFGYGHAYNCTSAPDFVATTVDTYFSSSVGDPLRGWRVVDEHDSLVNFTTSFSGGLIVTAPSTPSVVYLKAPNAYLGNKLWSYKQKLELEMSIITTGGGEILKTADVLLSGRGRNVTLYMTPSPSLNTNKYHVVLDEAHVTSLNSFTPFEFQSLLTDLTSLKVRAVFYPFPYGSVVYKRISLTHAVKNQTAPENVQVKFVEKALCHRNYSGLSCQTCAPGYKREVLGDDSFGRCVLCTCNGRSTTCHPDTGVCTNCEVGTYGDRCELCTNNVLEPNCTRCKPGYWGLTRNGCKHCSCHPDGALYGNNSRCDEVTGQCSCNATMNVDGRACDRCKENSWNASVGISDCRDCPSCYGFLQTDVHLLRPKITQAQTLTVQLAQHSVMTSNKNFALRLNESAQEVLELVQGASIAHRNDTAFKVKWEKLNLAVVTLETLVSDNLSLSVNSTFKVASRVQSNLQATRDAISKIVDLVQQDYGLLNTTVGQRIEIVESQLELLVHYAADLDNLTRQALELENSTLHSNRTLQAGVQYAVARANLTAVNARTVQEDQRQFGPYLVPLLKNATETKMLGQAATKESKTRRDKADSLLNETKILAEKAAQANPDNTKAILNIAAHSSYINTTSASYVNQTAKLFESSLPVMLQVHSAVNRAQGLVSDTSQVLENSTVQAARADLANQIAANATKKAIKVHDDATYMSHVVKNFEKVSHNASVKANISLSKTGDLKIQIAEVIANASHISSAIQGSVLASRRAVEQGKQASSLSEVESKVVSKALLRAEHLQNESKQAEILLSNQTLREYIKKEIEPKQNMCRNLTNTTDNLSTHANALLQLANETNAKAGRVSGNAQRAINESKVLVLAASNNSLPQLNEELAKVRQGFNLLNLTANITQLRNSLQEQTAKYEQYRNRKNTLMSEVQRVRELVRSFVFTNNECQN